MTLHFCFASKTSVFFLFWPDRLEQIRKIIHTVERKKTLRNSIKRMLLFVLVLVFSRAVAQLEDKEGANSTQLEDEEGTNKTDVYRDPPEYYNGIDQIAKNITRKISNDGRNSTNFTVCMEGYWVNSLNLTLPKNETNVIGVTADCVQEPFGIGENALKTNLSVYNENDTDITTLKCDSESGSFALGILGNVRNIVDENKYTLHMIYDVGIICGGLPEIVNASRYNWMLRCDNGTAMCAVQTHLGEVDGQLYTTGLTIGCCEVANVLTFSASTVLYVPVTRNDTRSNFVYTNGSSSSSEVDLKSLNQSSFCIGLDYIHEIRVEQLYSNVHKTNVYQLNFQCGTLMTKENKYDLLDMHHLSNETAYLQTLQKSRITTCQGWSLMVGVYVEESGEGKYPSWNPVCKPNIGFEIQEDSTSYEKKNRTMEKTYWMCPTGFAMCGVRRNHYLQDTVYPMEGVIEEIICCAIQLSLCEPVELDDQLDTDHCNVINADSICKVSFKVGYETSLTENEETQKRDLFSIQVGVKVGAALGPVSVSATVGAGYEREKINTEAKETTNTDMNSKVVTSSFHVKKGTKLLAFQKVLNCGEVSLRGQSIVQIVVPSNICEAYDTLVEIPESNYNITGDKVAFKLTGLGLKWIMQPKQNIDSYVKFDRLSIGIPENFFENVKLSPSPLTGFDWNTRKNSTVLDYMWKPYVKHEVWEETIDMPEYSDPKFYRVVGRCGDEWVVAVKKVVARPPESNSTEPEAGCVDFAELDKTNMI